MADDEPWKLNEDGFLNADLQSKCIICHPNLNVLLLITKCNEVIVIDVNTGSFLLKSSLSGKLGGNVQGVYLPAHDKVLFTDGSAVGVRSDYNGVLLLDTILQPPVQKPEDVVRLEILYTEAILLQKFLWQMDLSGVYQATKVLSELQIRTAEASNKTKPTSKSKKWSTVCLELPQIALKSASAGILNDLQRTKRRIPVLPVVSAINERLKYLLPFYPAGDSGESSTQGCLMFSEASRRETFSKWPHMNYKWASPDLMAQAGFFYHPDTISEDRAVCFTCSVCLEGWEPTDEPWSEHERHSPSCPFVKGDYTQSVPLSVTYATCPAIPATESALENSDSMILGTSSVPNLAITVNKAGLVNVWNVQHKLQKEASFWVVGGEHQILQFHEQEHRKHRLSQNHMRKQPKKQERETLLSQQDGEQNFDVDQTNSHDSFANVPKPPREAWLRAEEDGEIDVADISVTDLKNEAFVPKGVSVEASASSIVGGSLRNKGAALPQAVAVVGVELTPGVSTCSRREVPTWGGSCDVVRIMNDANQASMCGAGSLDIMKVGQESNHGCSSSQYDRECQRSLYLVVYDFYQNQANLEKVNNDGGDCGGSSGSGGACSNSKKKEKGTSAPMSGTAKKYVSGTGTSASSSGTRQENIISYPDLFLPKFLYDSSVISGGDIIISGNSMLDSLEFSPPASIYPPSDYHLHPPDYALNMIHPDISVSNTANGPILPLVNGYADSTKKNVSKKDVSCGTQEPRKVKSFEPSAIQCVPLPPAYRNCKLRIQCIQPTKDGEHILVVLSDWQKSIIQGKSDWEGEAMDVDGDDEEVQVVDNQSVLLMYALDFSENVVRINENPVNVRELKQGDIPIELSLLLLQEQEDDLIDPSDNGQSSGPVGFASVICADGKLRILDMSSLRFVAEANPNSSVKFISATYCHNLERICACTKKGSLHFFPLRLNEFGVLSPFQSIPQSIPGTSLRDDSPISNSDLLVNSSLQLEHLRQLLELTKCENLTPCFAATAPPAWSEIMQAQKQRRHPQHLQQALDAQHTRTWRLERTPNTSQEHVFDIILPKTCTIGQVFVKFSLQASYCLPPNIQVTLLKQNMSGIGRKPAPSVPVDSTVDFGIQVDGAPLEENPVLSEDYLQFYNAEILCGPVDLADCLDLSDQGGSIVLTSPKLVRSRVRALKFHIKALTDPTNATRNTENKTAKKCRMDGGASTSTSNNNLNASSTSSSKGSTYQYGASPSGKTSQTQSHFASSSAKKPENFVGCDWLQEISITFRCTKRTKIPFQKNQRCAMLEQNSFVEKLLNVICLEGPDRSATAQNLALDILIWVTYCRLSPHRDNAQDSCLLDGTRQQQLELGRIIKSNLSRLVQHCFLMSERSIAHKCLKLILICTEGMKVIKADEDFDFERAVLHALLDWLPSITAVKSAGSLRWYFLLLMRVAIMDTSGVAGRECVSLLCHVARELNARTNPYHLLLRTRFGLYGTPFEPELFDIDPPVSVKPASVPLTFASIVAGHSAVMSTPTPVNFGSSSGEGMNLSNDSFDLRDLLNGPMSWNPEKNNSMNAHFGNNTCGNVSSNGANGNSAEIFGNGSTPSNAGWSRLRGLASNHCMKGLLEVEPLHYTCHAASDGTKLEKIEPGCGCTIPVSNIIPLGTTGTKKADTDHMCCCKDIPEDKLEEVQSKLAQVVHSGLYSIYHDKVKPLGLLSQEGESSTTSSSQQSSANSSPWMPQYGAPDKLSTPLDPQQSQAQSQASAADQKTPSTSQESHDAPSCSSKSQESKKEKNHTSLLMQWQQLLLAPPQQTVVIDKMQSGARRFVVLDFGSPVLLTDLMIPACGDLLLLSVDVWLHSEEQDGERLVVASDISSKALILSDLQPPPLCRYLKLTTIGRYRMTPTRCKIPIGFFFGHTVILPGEYYSDHKDVSVLSESNLHVQISLLNALLEDIHCRYSLACSRLREMLLPLLQVETPAVVHMQSYLQRARDSVSSSASPQDDQKVTNAYHECITFQHQLNVVRSVIRRLESSRSVPSSDLDGHHLVSEASTDKLKVLGEGLLDVLLYLGTLPLLTVSMDRQVCEQLFHWLCVGQDTRMQLSAATHLLRLCGLKPWWGQFLADTFVNLYSSNSNPLFPQDRVFILLAYLGRKTLTIPSARCGVLDAILSMLGRLLDPLSAGLGSQPLCATIDLSLVSWSLLFVSQCLDVGSTAREDDGGDKSSSKESGLQNRWDFIHGEVAMQKRASSARKSSNAIRNKRIMVQKHLGSSMFEDFEATKKILQTQAQTSKLDYHQAKKAFQASTQALSALSSQAANISCKLEHALKHQEQYLKKSKHPNYKGVDLRIWEFSKPWRSGSGRRSSAASGSSGAPLEFDFSPDCQDQNMILWLPVEQCLPVAHGLVSLLLHMDFTCSIDMFLLACKVLAKIVWCSRPALALSDIMTEEQLVRLMRMAVWHNPHQTSWGGTWAAHAITCLLQDVLEGVQSRDSAPAEEAMDGASASSSSTSTSKSSKGVLRKDPPRHLIKFTSKSGSKTHSKGKSGSKSSKEFSKSASSKSHKAGFSSESSPGNSKTVMQSCDPSDYLPDQLLESSSEILDNPPNLGELPTLPQLKLTESQCLEVESLLDYISDTLGVPEEMIAEDCTDAAVAPSGSGVPSGSGTNALPIPHKIDDMIIESDDSELDDFLLDDLLEQRNSILKKGTNHYNSVTASSRSGSVSTAMDARLEYDVDSHSEVLIRRLTMLRSYNLPFSVQSIFHPLTDTGRSASQPPPWQQLEGEPASSFEMLSVCFETIFSELQVQGSWTNLELVLQLWLTLNTETNINTTTHRYKMNTGRAVYTNPAMRLSPSAISGLLSALTWQPELSVRTWCLAFQCLQAVTASNSNTDEITSVPDDSKTMATAISNDPQFVPMLLRFLSGSGLNSQNSDVGPTVCDIIRRLLVRLRVNTDLTNTFLEIAHQLTAPWGALAGRRGPLDAQCTFFDMLVGHTHVGAIDVELTMKLLESIGILIHTYVMTSEKVHSFGLTEANDNAFMCFDGVLPHMTGKEVKTCKWSSWDALMCSVLKLACGLVQLPLNAETLEEKMDLSEPSTSQMQENVQTDEHKVKHKENGSKLLSDSRTIFIADKVLQHQPTMARLLSCLAGCVGSQLAVWLGSRGERDTIFNSISAGEPISVGDGIFHLLHKLSRKASHHTMLLKPILDFLMSAKETPPMGPAPSNQPNSSLQLSEPVLWFIMKVLNNKSAVGRFESMGGIEVISKNLVNSSRQHVSPHPSLVSVIMQHLGRATQPMSTSLPTSNNKKSSFSSENYDGSHNFAPLGTITCSSPTAQPAEVLIQASPSHRRARTPAWSYHFHPDQLYIDLILRLPCAILLREVQLQPHLTSLATCPSAVGLEVSADGNSPLVPICTPLQTSGMTFVRLTLDKPEVVSSVLLRLYRPFDSTNIGLSQVLLLGSTTFGGIVFKAQNWDLYEEEFLTKSSLGWLRLLQHCLSVAEDSERYSFKVVSSAAKVPGLLDACVGFLLLPAPVPPVLTSALRQVLLLFSQHSRELGLHLLQSLLRSSTIQIHGYPMNGSDSVVDLLFLLGTEKHQNLGDFVEAMLGWLEEMATAAIETQSETSSSWISETNFSASCIQCIACVLWKNQFSAHCNFALSEMISMELFNKIYHWISLLPDNSAVKLALDAVLCSICSIRPELFPVLLSNMGAIAPGNGSGSSTDEKSMDADVSGSMTDDSKEALGSWSGSLLLTGGQLLTIGMACQSTAAVSFLLDSGLLNLLAHSVLDFSLTAQEEQHQSKPSSSSSFTTIDKIQSVRKVEKMASILKLFLELCSHTALKDWLGGPDGSLFWLPLLTLLCNSNTRYSSSPELSQAYAELEIATLQFLSRCCNCHLNNQLRLSTALKDVILQQESRHHNVSFLHGISGFTRRLILQLLLESEKITVLVWAESPLKRPVGAAGASGLRHPRYGVGGHYQLMSLSTQTTCAELIKAVSVSNNNNKMRPSSGDRAEGGNSAGPVNCWSLFKQAVVPYPLSYSAGVTAKDKRTKEAKNAATRGPYAKKTRINDPGSGGLFGAGLSPEKWLEHELLPDMSLPSSFNLAQLMKNLKNMGYSETYLILELKQASSSSEETPKDKTPHIKLSLNESQTPLQVFSAQGGLALLAQHLPLIYPETLRYTIPDKPMATASSPDNADADWAKSEENNVDTFEDLDDSLGLGVSSPHSSNKQSNGNIASTSVPPHSLAAFGLFLRLPGYAEVLLLDRKRAQCLLRLVLGVSDDGEGGEILTSHLAPSLPTLPFQVLRLLLDTTPLTTDDGLMLRRTAIDVGALHLLLACLAVFSHQSQDIHLPGMQHELVIAATKATNGGTDAKPTGKIDDKNQCYWAKGTGFGTGSTTQAWNVEQALLRQRSEEEHVTVLLQAISSYLNPGDVVPPHYRDSASDSSDSSDLRSEQPRLPAQLATLLQQSCLLPAVCSYLRNDSVLDMARHIPLYRAVLQVLRALAVSTQLVSLLLPVNRRYNRGGAPCNTSTNDTLSVVCLLTKMKGFVDTYASRLKVNKTKGSRKTSSSHPNSSSSRLPNKYEDDLEQDEGLAQLIVDIQHTANLVQVATNRLVLDDDTDSHSSSPAATTSSALIERPMRRTLEECYLEVMQRLQFDTFEMITENNEGGYQFAVSYHFEPNLKSAGERYHPARVKRLAQETVTLSTSLPLSYSSSVYVRCDSDRLDIMKVLITGPAETPYANGCFEFDVYFPPDYPTSPMMINMETTGRRTIRFNPNLYNDGKVCLSVLNTWHGRPEEKWNAQTSSFLQVLVSIQSLILVPEPYFNEPGYERSRGTPTGNQSSKEYNANICQASVRWAMLEQVRNPCPCFREVIHTHFWFKKKEIIKQIESWIADMESQGSDRRNGRSISLNTIALKRHFEQLQEELNKLKPPPGMEDLAEQLHGEEEEEEATTSSSPGASATPSVASLMPNSHTSHASHSTPFEHSDVDTDMEMEKIVSKVCD